MTLNTEVISSDYPNQDLYQQPSATRLVFIDSQVEDYQSLIAGVLPETSVVVLEADRDGIEQISQVLASHQKVNSLHIVSHGAPGRVQLGNSQLSNKTLNRYAAQLKSWANILSNDTQLLLYGCQVAQTDQGIAFIKHLSKLTGATVTASNNLMGSTFLGGDWELQVSTGAGDPPLAFRQEVMTAYTSVLASGVLDTTFDSDGKVTTDFGGLFDSGNSIVLQSNGQILVAGTSNGNFAVARYNSNGTLDTSFDSDGKVTTDFVNNDSGNSIILQSNGQILVAGTSNGDFAVARYNNNGSLDTTFGTAGKITTDFGSNESGNSIVLQSNGQILVAGTSNGDFAVARYNSNGTLDTTFGTGGKITTELGIFDSGNSIVLQSDGQILVAGASNGDFAVARYNSNGTLDTTFGTGGKITTEFGSFFDSGNSIVLQSDGQILVAGASNGDFAVARYNSNGILDTTFGTAGKVTTEFGSFFDNGYSAVLQPDGQILVAGTSNGDFAVARYLINQIPTDISLSNSTINENSGNNTVVGNFSTTNPEAGDTFSYTLVAGAGDLDNAAFTIDGDQLVINNSPDFETKSGYNIRVQTTDSNGLAFEKELTINVNDLNEAPTDLVLSQTNVDENSGNNTVIGNFSTTNPEAGDTFSYTLVAGAGDLDNAAFTIDGDQLVINNSPDFETKSGYNIRVQTADSGGISFEKAITINVNDLNEAPTDLVLSQTNVDENVAALTGIGTFTTIDPDIGNTFNYNFISGTGSTDNETFIIDGNRLKIKNSPDFETKSTYNIRVRSTDNGGLAVEKALTININDLDIPSRLTNTTDDIFNITGDGAKVNLQFSLTGSSSNQINELGLFTVDDALGTINGITPGTAGYAQAALERSQVIFASISNSPNGFDTNNLTRILELDSGDNLRFYLVKNGTTDNVRSGVTPITDLLFADASTQQITDLGTDIFSLGWKDAAGNSNADFQDLVVRVQPTNQALPVGANLQGEPQAELIDLRGVTTQMKADFIVNREAASNNYISFYQVADQNGGIDTDGNGTVDLLPGDLGYTQAAVNGRVAGIDLTVNNQGTATYSSIFQPGAIFAPFLIVNGTPDAILDGNTNNDPAVYFSFLGANLDQVDHISLLGDNIFGFEDLPGGGDKDFNDMTVRVNLTIA
ncbi:DUF4347 domain-containing protein [Cylindrospermum stagnale]|nr:DUF4347 domain-containing protein [Cylindrospermum stagnale]